VGVDEKCLNYLWKAVINVFCFGGILAKNQLFQAVTATAGKSFPTFPSFYTSPQLPAQNLCENERVVEWIFGSGNFHVKRQQTSSGLHASPDDGFF